MTGKINGRWMGSWFSAKPLNRDTADFVTDGASLVLKDGQLMAHLSLDIKNPQIATFIPDWNKVNEQLASGLMDEDDYKMWVSETGKLKRFIKAYEPFVEDMICAQGHCSRFDN